MSAAVTVFVVCAAVCAIANLAILLSTLGRPAAAGTAVGGMPRPNRAAEIVWALVPIVMLAFVLTATWARVRERDAPPRPVEVMKVAR